MIKEYRIKSLIERIFFAIKETLLLNTLRRQPASFRQEAAVTCLTKHASQNEVGGHLEKEYNCKLRLLTVVADHLVGLQIPVWRDAILFQLGELEIGLIDGGSAEVLIHVHVYQPVDDVHEYGEEAKKITEWSLILLFYPRFFRHDAIHRCTIGLPVRERPLRSVLVSASTRTTTGISSIRFVHIFCVPAEKSDLHVRKRRISVCHR